MAPAVPVWRLPGMPSLALLSLLGFSGYGALLAVVPLWAVRGGASEAGAGWTTGVLLLSTVASQLTVPALLRRWRHGPVLVVGCLLLGVPAPAYLFSDSLGWVLAVCTVRGWGFGILTVIGSAVVAHLVPPERRGAAIGIYGLAVATPMVLLLPGSVPLASGVGYAAVFWLGALPVLALPAALRLDRWLPEHPGHPEPLPEEAPHPDRSTVLSLLVPTLVLFTVTMAGGALMTFVPQVLAADGWSAAVLLVLGLGSALCRWLAGAVADRHGAARFVTPLLVSSAVGLVLCAGAAAYDGNPGLMLAGAAVVGVGYGALQNLTLVLAFSEVPPGGVPVASAAWNIGYDSGTAIGAVLMGAVAAASSFAAGFVVLAALAVLAVLLPHRAPVPRPGA